MSNWRVLTVVDVLQDNPISLVPDHGESKGISAAIDGHAVTGVSVAQIAEVTKRGVIRQELWLAGTASPAEAAAQREAVRKSPGDCESFLRGKEVRTRHSRFILISVARIV